MADKWADFLISRVKYSGSPRHIVGVEMRLDKGTTVGNPVQMSRAVVLAWLGAGYSVCTIRVGKEGWVKGALVKLDTIGGVAYIRTIADKSKADNLGELPEF
jgi:Protein of unknown function (DUF3892)